MYRFVYCETLRGARLLVTYAILLVVLCYFFKMLITVNLILAHLSNWLI